MINVRAAVGMVVSSFWEMVGFFFADATVSEFLKGAVDGATVFVEMYSEFLYTEFALRAEGVEDGEIM
jgi:hypothetical protein